MKKSILFLVLLLMSLQGKAQNMYDRAAEVSFINTYVPIDWSSTLHIATMAAKERKYIEEQRLRHKAVMKANFEYYVKTAYEYLRKGQTQTFINYAHAALNCKYYNTDLYYNLGIAYMLVGKKKKGKKFLKEAQKRGHTTAKLVLMAVKYKSTVTPAWFNY